MKKVSFRTVIKRFAKNAEKTGWTYIEIPADVATQLKPGNKRTFRVKGLLDKYSVKQVAVMPMGDGNFILPLNAEMRKGTGKKHGAMLEVILSEDKSEIAINSDLMACLEDEPGALNEFNKLSNSHRNYFSKWIQSAKTESTKANRIALTITALLNGMNFGEMLRSRKKEKV